MKDGGEVIWEKEGIPTRVSRSSLQFQQLLLTIVVFTQLEHLSERSRGRSGGGGELDGGELRTVGVTTATREGVKPERARESVCVNKPSTKSSRATQQNTPAPNTYMYEKI